MMALMMCGVTTAATINVPADYSTIQAAVDAASNGDEIVVAPGTYTSSQPGHVVDTLGKAIAIRSSGGAAVTFIDGEGVRRGLACFSGEADTTIVEGFTIKSCFAVEFDYDNDGNVSIWKRSGGGILCYQSSPTLTDCTISGNTASDGWGGGISCYSGSNPTITGCTISGNTTDSSGGGIFCSNSSPTITDCVISENTSHWGGGISCGSGSPTITDCTITDNTASNDGGGIHCNFTIPTISDCTISGNTAGDDGGGISCNLNSLPTITGCTISGNTAGDDGGGIRCDINSNPTLSGCTISDNTASDGGGIYCYNGSNPTITDCTITDNTANSYGGGIYCNGSSPTITDCVISGNTASDDGGGIHCYNGGSPTITGCTISDNTASDGGGGIYCNGSSPTITDCTISNNTASDGGGGIYCNGSSPTITDCTISNNTADTYGGGIYCHGVSPTLIDTVVCENAPDNIYGSLTDGGGVCLAYSCWDGDGNGVPDKCDGSIGDGIFNVPSEYATVQAAINVAGYGDTVLVGPGTYTGSGDWVINPSGKPITIRATGTSEETILDGEGARRVVLCSSGEGADTVIEGFTITGGRSYYGGAGIYCHESSPAITNCTISGNTAPSSGFGGGIRCDNSSPTIRNCNITANWTSNSGGGIFAQGGSPLIEDCLLGQNAAEKCGGAVYCDSDCSLQLRSCELTENTAGVIFEDGGSAVYFLDSSIDIFKCSFLSNQIIGDGRGCILSDAGNVTINGCLFQGNTSFGTILWFGNDTQATVTDCTFERNVASSHTIYSTAVNWTSQSTPKLLLVGCTFRNNACGGVYVRNTIPWPDVGTDTTSAVIRGCVFDSNQGNYYGGGIQLGAPVTDTITIESCEFLSNYAVWGGGIYSSSATVVVSDCSFDGNASPEGGAIHNRYGTVTVSDCLVLGNQANTGGGGFWLSQCNATIRNCSFTDNSAVGDGGGIYVNGLDYGDPPINTRVTLSDCTFEGNLSSHIGGGLSLIHGGVHEVIRCTFDGNSGKFGGGVGIGNGGYKNPTFLNFEGCDFTDNTSSSGAGVYVGNNGVLGITNCWISGNSSSIFDGGGLGTEALSDVTVAMTVICSNVPEQTSGPWEDGGGNTIGSECPLPCPDPTDDGVVGIADLLVVLEHWGIGNSIGDVVSDGVVDLLDLNAIIDNWGPCE